MLAMYSMCLSLTPVTPAPIKDTHSWQPGVPGTSTWSAARPCFLPLQLPLAWRAPRGPRVPGCGRPLPTGAGVWMSGNVSQAARERHVAFQEANELQR